MKDLFRKIPSLAIFAVLIAVPLLFLFKTNIKDNSVASFTKNLSAVPMSWDLDKVRSEISRSETKYNDAFFNGSDPNGSFMKTQEASMAGMRARQYDLESEQALGYSLNTYNPDDYTSSKFMSDGRPTPAARYEPGAPKNTSQNKPATDKTKPNTTTNDTGLEDDPYYAGSEKNFESQTSQDTPWDQQKHHQGDPWGGLVVSRISCTCEQPNYIVILNDFVIKGSRVLKVDYQKTGFYLFYDLKPGQYGLGTFDKNAICKIRVGNKCINFQVDGVINKGPGFGSSGVMGGGGLPSLSSTPTGPNNVVTF